MSSAIFTILFYLVVGFFIFRIAKVIKRRIDDKRSEDFENRDN